MYSRLFTKGARPGIFNIEAVQFAAPTKASTSLMQGIGKKKGTAVAELPEWPRPRPGHLLQKKSEPRARQQPVREVLDTSRKS